jgi:hypothetical protein
MGGNLAIAAANAIANVDDQRKRLVFEQNFSLLNLDQQSKLNELLVNSKSETERLNILTQALAASNVQRINNISNLYAEQEKKKRNQQLVIGSGILLVGIIAIVIIIKKV